MAATSACLFRSAISEQILDSTIKAASIYLDEELSPPEVPDSLCCTHWLPISSKSWPDVIPARPAQHALEDSALEVARVAAQARLPPLQGSEAVIGLEGWLQEQGPEDLPKEIHTDKALIINRSGDSMSSVSMHPLVSSVFYLSDTGGPTAIFESNAPDALPHTVSIALPSKGSLLLFKGDLLHSVLHPPEEPLATTPSETAPRRTLLVNFWSHKPPGATDAPLPSLPPAIGEQYCRETTDVVACDGAENCGTWGDNVGQVASKYWILKSETSFAQQAPCWKKQMLPEETCRLAEKRASEEQDARSSAVPLLVVQYPYARGYETDKFP